MSVFDLFSNNPSQDDFALLAIQALMATRCQSKLHYNQELFAIDIDANGKPSQRWYLYSVFEQYCASNKNAKRELLNKHAKNLSMLPAGSLPAQYCDAKHHIYPDIKEPIIWESARLEKLLSGQIYDGLAFRYIINELAIVLTYETETTKLIIKNKHLKKWNIDFEEVCRDAIDNLRAISPRIFTSVVPGVYASTWKDGYDAARIILLDVFEELSLEGLPVIAIPNNNTLLVSGSNDTQGLSNLAIYSKNILRNEHSPLSGYCVMLNNGGISIYPLTSDTAAVDLYNLNMQWAANNYAQQKLILERLLTSIDTKISIAPFEIISPADSQIMQSMCVVFEGDDILIPKTDIICFQKHDANNYALVAWALAMDLAGELFDKTTYVPARFRVTNFPSNEIFEQLQSHSTYSMDDCDVCWLE